ncbi:MAG: cytochrome c oxidase subunit I [Acidimicrobiales bacterium]
MTLTASPPDERLEAQPPGAPSPDVSPDAPVLPESLFTTSDHKRLGRAFLVAATLFVLVSAVVGVILEIELSARGVAIVGNEYGRLYSLHSTAGALLFLPGLFLGLAFYVVPLQIGARRLVFPRMAALALWSYVVGGILLLSSYAFGRPNGAGITLSLPLVPVRGVSRATDLWVASMGLITIAVLLASATLFVTVLKCRVEGMTMARVPAFSWSIFTVSAATLLSAPVFLAGLLILYLDQHFDGNVFAARQVNGGLIWQHLLWLYGRPDVYLVAVPCLGALTDIVTTHSRRRLLQPIVAKGLIVAAAVLSFGIEASNASVERAVLLPTPSVLSAAVAVPIALLALLWLGTIRPNQLRPHVSLLYLAGFLLVLVAGALNAVIAPSQHLVGGVNGSEWTVGQIHALLFAAPTLAAFAGIYHWSPKIWGRGLHQVLGALQALLLLGGFLLTSLGAWLAGYAGAAWHLDDYAGRRAGDYFNYAKLSSAGGVLVALGLLVFLANVAMTAKHVRGAHVEDLPGDPYDGSTLEWATTSPPPPHNFDALPEVRSDAPLADARTARAGGAA